ncbi:MAG: galactose oxidase-like domain-containing protein, partial [Saprospiraceae bacterium]
MLPVGRAIRYPTMNKTLLALFAFFLTCSASAQTLTGTITNATGMPLANTRVTLFTGDTTMFWETRTDASGQYLFENLPAGGPYLFFGAAKPGFEYFESATPGIIGTIVLDAQLLPETNTGLWNTIVDSPEPLGGTDLGVLLSDGRIYYCHSTKDPFVFDPALNDTISIPGDTKVQGCVAPKLMWNGNVIMAGGTEQEFYGPGTRKIKQFNLATKTWQPLPLMLDYRWYPSMTQLADGRLLIVGGGNLSNPIRTNSSELYNPLTGTTEFADTVAIRNEQSPILTLYSGKALMTFRPPQLFDPVTKQWELAADFVQGNRMPNGDHVDHELVHLPEGNVIAIGFKPFPAGSGGNLVERYNPIANTWTLRANFEPLRSRPETVLTPDRRILVIAGAKENPADPTPVNQWGYMDLTDQYDPYADTWRRLAPMPRKREYHALAVLVPDGRVIVVGGEGSPGNEPPKSIIDAYRPPYLFRGVRPQILNLGKTDYQRGETIHFDIARTNAPTSVVLQSTQAVTHMMNCGENRFLDLNFSMEGQSVTAQIPGDSLHALPGWYMLWVMVDDIPSEARIVRIMPGQPVVAINEAVEAAAEFTVFPNPAQRLVYIERKKSSQTAIIGA